MSASVRPQRRRLAAVVAGTALLALSATACGFEDQAAVGIVTYEPVAAAPAEGHGEAGHGAEAGAGGHGAEAGSAEEAGHGAEAGSGGHGAEAAEAEGVSETNPRLKGCHVMKGGAGKIENHTMADLVAYVGTDCTGESKHVGSKLTGDIAPDADAWNSYRFVQ
ncbi:hypothetical protein QIS99_02655 [Streptomyces sp. B-S-A8]|uniref:Lipoprotein n=1 Tax=Streptomyces solicavernae TaxID=3043614 RepID=A0ABT6RL13_9ACTN|nr:hypothetical protein [Streptomyces sp. B-S-A8]MDI3385122.1 hypothetical protein [Streptomyces sp. B-S-A8]